MSVVKNGSQYSLRTIKAVISETDFTNLTQEELFIPM